jgi:1-acyl-sn-glycerol-3-phosphate acyltransferase
MMYYLFRALFRAFFTVFYRYQVSGAEHVPHDRAAIICPNHISNLDPPLVGCALEPIVHYMAKEELFRVPVIGWLIKSWHAFPVNRQGGGRQGLKLAMQALREGKVLGVFPEGTRSKTGELGKVRLGPALLATKTDAVLVPAAIIGPYRLFRPIRIIFGEPLEPSRFQDEKNPTQALTDQLIVEIKRLQQQGS